MGREIRRVSKGWEHPSRPMEPWQMDNFYHRHHKPGEYGYGLRFEPMYDNDIETVWREWFEGWEQWQRGEHPAQIKHPDDYLERSYASYAEYEGRSPDPESYRAEAWTPEQATCYQIYETVSEGTPVSPVFETLDELQAWLIEQGYSEKAAEGFAKTGWVPSGVISPQHGIVTGIEIAGLDFSE